ncbi:MAG: 30S ribosome-binding factor RbfA [bacterium]|jgi:ribosome-binding factor A
MKTDRLIRINELLRREISVVLYRLIDQTEFDMSSTTVTHVIVSPDLHDARVLVSIRGHEHERRKMLRQLQLCHADIQSEVAKAVILKYTPRLTFVLDTSIEQGDHVLDILSKIPIPAESQKDSDTTEPA